MLNVPASGDDATASSDHPLSPRHRRRRPLTGGERQRGWADVHELHDDQACTPKYHVDLNLTAHLNWDDWQRLCAAEPLQTDPPTWCLLMADDQPLNDDEQPHEASNPGDEARNPPSQRPPAPRFVRRQAPPSSGT